MLSGGDGVDREWCRLWHSVSRQGSGKIATLLGEDEGVEPMCRNTEQYLFQVNPMFPLEIKSLFITWCFPQACIMTFVPPKALLPLWAPSSTNSIKNYILQLHCYKNECINITY